MPAPQKKRSSDLPTTSDPFLGVHWTKILKEMRELNSPSKTDQKNGQSIVINSDTRNSSLPIGIRYYIPEHEGSGYWEHLRIKKGIFLNVTDASYEKPIRIKIPKEPILKVRILLSGTLRSLNGDILAKGGEAHIHSLNENSEMEYYIDPEGGRLQIIILHCREHIFRNMGLSLDTLEEPFKTIVGTRKFPDKIYPVNWSLRFKNLGQEILQSRDNFHTDTRRLLLATKSEEILYTAIESMRQRPILEIGANKMTNKDLVRLNEARHIIESSLSSPPTITKLSKMVGINATKLKLGYRALFGKSIGSDINHLRLKAALALIENSDMSFAEIGYKVGYNYPANFSQAFKNHFGRSPKAARSACKSDN